MMLNLVNLNWYFMLTILLFVMMASYLTLLERLILALIQNSSGPSKVGGVFSMLQPLTDGVKLLFKTKKNIIYTNTYLFNFLFMLLLNLAFFLILFMPMSNKILLLQIPFNLMFVIIMLLMSSIILMLIGLLSGNKLSILSSLSHFAALYSYSLSIIMIFFGVAFMHSSFTIMDIKVNLMTWSYMYFNFFFMFWILIILVNELKKVGFDMLESEGELAGGFSMEFSGFNFALLVLSEYLFFMSFLFIMTITLGPKMNSIILFLFLLVLVLIFSAILPNYSFDYIMTIYWKYLFIMIFLSNMLIMVLCLV